MANEAEKTWTSFQGISKEEFAVKTKEGAFDKHLNDPAFMDAVKTEKLFEKTVEKPIEKPIVPTEPTVVPVVPVSSPETPPVQDGQKWWEKEGYAAETEAVEAHSNMRQLLDKKQSQIDTFNAERGKILKENGRIAQLEADLKREREERSRMPTAAPSGVDVPDMPIAPMPVDGDFGSPEYKAARTNYETEVRAYKDKMRTLISTTREDNLKLRNELTEVKTKTTSLETVSQEVVAERQRLASAEQWNEAMKQVAKLQEHDQTLKTSKAFDDINKFVRGHGLEEAKKVFPAKDLENFDRLCDVIKTAYNVDGDGNVDFGTPKYKSLKMARYAMLEEEGKLDEFLHTVKINGERKGREQVIKAIEDGANHARPLPVGGTQGEIINEITDADVDRDLAEYSKPEYEYLWKSKEPIHAEAQKKVYDTLSKKAEKDPRVRSLIPTAWITRFENKG